MQRYLLFEVEYLNCLKKFQSWLLVKNLEYPERKPIKLRVENGEVFAITNAFSKRALGNMKCSEETEDFKSLSSIVENKSLGPSREELIAEIEEKIVEKQRSI